MASTSNTFPPSQSNSSNNLPTSRHASIVEMLSTPPLLPHVQVNDTDDKEQPEESTPPTATAAAPGPGSAATPAPLRDEKPQFKLSAVPMTQTPSQCLSCVHAQKWQHIPLSQLIE